MLFVTPPRRDEPSVVELIEDVQRQLRWHVTEPRRWQGTLRRLTFARAVQGSNSIEGYTASLDDVVAALDDEEPLDAATETRLALQGYRDAMTYVLQLGHDGGAEVDESLLRSLHFMMLKHELAKNPGRWRPGPIWVRREADGEIVYEGPGAEEVPALVGELVESLRAGGDDTPVLVRAAMAHLNLVMIHPFSDGNGRMARCLQTFMLARARILSPEFNSIEEYLGRNTQAYYEVLAEVGQGGWHPEHDAGPWVRFCLTAHYRQARTLVRRVEESERLWDALSELVRGSRAPERSVGALFDAAIGFRLRRATYRASVAASSGEEVTEQSASRDLRTLVDAGLLEAKGEKRGRVYTATPAVRDAWLAIRRARAATGEDDPFELVKGRAQTRLAL